MSSATGLARLAVQALAGAGVGHVVLCPGSRSAPLAYELARVAGSGLELHVRHDERVAAFTALGVGLSGRSVGAVVTTSGTAVANLHPAVLEAHHGGRPLVVVTADRPPALRGTWANQTSDLQADLFGGAVRSRLDLDDVTAALDPGAASRTLAQAVAAARGAGGRRPGPVHLNLGFGEPLLPEDGAAPAAVAVPDQPANEGFGAPLHLPAGPRTVVLAGDGAGAVARAVAEAAGLPLLAEPSSGARGGSNAIGPYRLLLELDSFGGAVERVVVFGRPTLSRPVTRLLARPEVEVVVVSPFGDHPHPGRPVVRCFAVTADPARPDWLAAWCAAGEGAASAIDAVLDADAAAGVLTGPLLAREMWAAARPGEQLVVAASNPIRDVDLAARPCARTPSVFANRGLSGIDGTVSTATGLALASSSARVLVGDVAFLHDLNGLLAGPGDRRPELQVVVLNDDGGGIFGLLEYGALAESGPAAAVTFDRLFGTPHAADLGALCRGYGVPHELVKDVGRLRAVLAEPAPGVSVVEVRADRAALRDLHARFREAARAGVAASRQLR